MRFTLQFNMDNAAFHDDEVSEGYELRRVLRRVAADASYEAGGRGTVMDVNGNTIGYWEVDA